MKDSFNSILGSVKSKIREQGGRFLVCGIVNTLFGYFGAIGLYSLLRDVLSTIFVVVISQVMTITFSFTTYKIFIFKTKGQWLREYLRCYASYGAINVITMSALIVLVDLFGVPFWVAQLFAICLGVAFSFIAHSYYTFSERI